MTLKRLLRRRGKDSFIANQSPTSIILDVGCGNNSPYQVKQALPLSTYIGIDVKNYNQAKPNIADRYILTTPKNFTREIKKFNNFFDSVICSHNIEHCDDPNGTLIAILDAIKTEGWIYLSFPCEDSVNFPSRKGTLNYYDDKTHNLKCPNYNQIIKIMLSKGFSVEFERKKYKPILLWVMGCLLEPYSRYKKVTYSATWAFYGFESVIWAKKKIGGINNKGNGTFNSK